MKTVSVVVAGALLALAPAVVALAQDSAAAPGGAGRGGELRFTSITAGGGHSCGLTADSAAYCWGRNEFGQLGDSSNTDQPSPVRVRGGIAFRQLAAGADHTCGADGYGTAYCWGKNDAGQAGTGFGTSRNYPVPVAGRQRMKLITAGAVHSCATIQHWEHEDRLYCWGRNSDGQLGNREVQSAGAPAPAFGTIRYTSIAAGSRHTCGVSSAGNAMCWGANKRGQLGNGSVTNSNVPFLIRVTGRVKFTSVTVGAAHSCALTSEDEVYCWGENSSGQLGTGKRGNSIMPQRFDRSLRFMALSAGGDATCGVRRDGALFCWGSNASGQFGTDATTGSLVPLPVLPGTKLTTVALGRAHACGLQEDGAAYCWGTGLVGNGGAVGPVRVAEQR